MKPSHWPPCWMGRLGLALVFAVSAASGHAITTDPQPAHVFAESRPIPNRYIVVFKPTVDHPGQETARIMRGLNGQVHHTFSHAIKGFSATLPAQALEAIQRNPNVDHVEQDQSIRLNQVSSPQNQATWGIDRIDQADRPLDTQYRFNYTGAGVTAFVIDTGIRADHAEFTGRLSPGFDAIGDGYGTHDCNGHGTHVAGTVGGSTWGVAKGVTLVPVRVLDCSGSGSFSGVISGIDWAAGTAIRPAVANMSLGGGKSASMNAAVAGAVSKGITMVVAAGNNNANACNYSPASEPTAITVGATASSDARASYSNYGSCVDIFAPGSNITSAWFTSGTATHTISGTSMASPHVAGVTALALNANPQASPAAVSQFLVSHATPNRLSSIGSGSPNKLVFSLAPGAPGIISSQTVAIQSLVGSGKKSGPSWQAMVTATVRDISNGAAVANASITGSFSPGSSVSCTTSTNGSCTLVNQKISSTYGTTNFTVLQVSGSNLVYDASQNSATQITIPRP